jgi:hypothetical protein
MDNYLLYLKSGQFWEQLVELLQSSDSHIPWNDDFGGVALFWCQIVTHVYIVRDLVPFCQILSFIGKKQNPNTQPGDALQPFLTAVQTDRFESHRPICSYMLYWQHSYILNGRKIIVDIFRYFIIILSSQNHSFVFVAGMARTNPKWCEKWCRYTVQYHTARQKRIPYTSIFLKHKLYNCALMHALGNRARFNTVPPVAEDCGGSEPEIMWSDRSIGNSWRADAATRGARTQSTQIQL